MTTGKKTEHLFSKISHPELEMADDLLAYEFQKTTERTNLSTKNITDSRCKELLKTPLWPEGIASPLETSSVELFSELNSGKHRLWSFWEDWYHRILKGSFTDWDLATEVAKIPDDVWDKGAEAVANEIRGIERRLKTAVGPQLKKIKNNKWDREGDEAIAAEPFSFAVSQVELALSSALGAQMNNGMTETSPETILIRGACGQYREQHSVVATSFWNACMSLSRNIGDLYPDSAALIVLKNTLYTSVEEMCEWFFDGD